MRGILNKRGMPQCYNYTEGKIYTFAWSGTDYVFNNDVGHSQSVTKDGVTELPSNGFVVQCTYHLGAYPWKEHEYLVVTDGSKAGRPGEYYDVCGHHYAKLSIIRQADCRVVQPLPVAPTAHIEFDDSIPWEPEEPKKRAPKLVPDILTSENKKIIKKQKALAAELLERLGSYGNAIIAGGAPRNWWFNRPANDLDIFIPAPTDFTGKNLRAIMEREGITDVYNMATHNPDGTLKAKQPRGKSSYDDRMSDIHSVFEGQYCGQTVQVIWTTVSTYGYIESHFDTSINMIFSVLSYDELTICPTHEFNQGVETGAIYVHDNQVAYTNAHLEKVANYFPEVPLVWYEEKAQCIKDPSYVLEVAKSWEDHLQDQMDAENESRDDCW